MKRIETWIKVILEINVNIKTLAKENKNVAMQTPATMQEKEKRNAEKCKGKREGQGNGECKE